MTKKSEIVVEQFTQGVTIRWKDVDGKAIHSKDIAIHGTECSIIGKNIWKDVAEILYDTMTDKVRVKIECESI